MRRVAITSLDCVTPVMPDLTTAARSTFTTALMALLKLCVMLATTTTPMLPAMLPKTKCICGLCGGGVVAATTTTAGLPSFFFGFKIICSREGHSVASFRRISFFTPVPHFGRFRDVCFTLPYIVSYYLSVAGNRWHNHY